MRKKDKEAFEQMQDSINQLKANQHTEDVIVRAISSNGSQTAAAPVADFCSKEEISKEDMLKAAYALNLCTVSVSQIIDYNDIYILEQEYEAILNNLNLEEMPKDNALLSTLKQILDTVTFFRIQEGDKKFIDLKYQQRVKDAIWSAVPNIGIIFAGGNPVTLAVSLISQVGMGYMNYRKAKSKINLEYEEEKWKLQRSAIEQFNGLRRELFDTAWRLADKYNFPDDYRLTERQISQYNAILMDPDNSRRFERLLSIKDKFNAYLPYWYYLGNAARAISTENASSDSINSYFLKYAQEYYKHYLDFDEKYSLLRENSITCACALEYIELPGISETERIKYLKRAIEMSGNAPDILQLCAMSYLSLGKYPEASKLLRGLINEGYNTIINSQILSLMYATAAKNDEKARDDYTILAKRVNCDYLAELPMKGQEFDYENFISKQRKILLVKYLIVLKQIHDIYNEKYNELIPRVENPETFFSKEGIYNDYWDSLKRADISNTILQLFNHLVASVDELHVSKGDEHDKITNQLKDNKDVITTYEKKVESLNKLVELDFDSFTSEYFIALIDNTVQMISGLDSLDKISSVESKLMSFGMDHREIGDPSYLYEHLNDKYENPFDDSYFKYDMFYDNNPVAITETFLKIEDNVNTTKGNINCKEVSLLTHNDMFDFNNYFANNNRGGNCVELRKASIAVIDDLTKRNRDLIITLDKYYLVKKGKVRGSITAQEVSNVCDHYPEAIIKLIKKIEDEKKGIKAKEDIFMKKIDKVRRLKGLPSDYSLQCLLDSDGDGSGLFMDIEEPVDNSYLSIINLFHQE